MGLATEDFIKTMRKRFDSGVSYDYDNMLAAREDIKFVAGEHWSEAARTRRNKARKPVLTVNRLPAFVAQVVNNRLMNETMIRVVPDNGGNLEAAALRESLIRSIYKNSDADLAQDEALKYQVICGVGYWYLDFDYANDDVFYQDIKLKHCHDPFQVVLDPFHTKPCGGDAQWGFIIEEMSRDDFKDKYPDKTESDTFGDTLSVMAGTSTMSSWYGKDSIRIVKYYQMIEKGTKTLAILEDGRTVELLNAKDTSFENIPVKQRDDGSLYVRTIPKKYASLTICSGSEVLEPAVDYPCTSIPIFKASGWELRYDGRVNRFGMVRFMKDPARFHDFWRSAMAEQLIATPRNKYIATRSSVAGLEDKWRKAHLSDDPLLIYNDDTLKPERIPPTGIDAGLMNEAGMAAQDLKDVSNIHEAALGMPSNEVSGRAVNARQNISDIGTFIYHDRLRIANERCANVINELIPYFYDTTRLVKVIGAGDKYKLAMINDVSNPNSDITIGKYGVTVTTGVSTVTKRAQTAEQMQAFVNANPQQASMFMDIIAKSLDWEGSEAFVTRFQVMAPEGIIPEDELTPEAKQLRAVKLTSQQQEKNIGAAQQQLQMEKILSQADADRSRAAKNMADMHKTILDMQMTLGATGMSTSPPAAETFIGQNPTGALAEFGQHPYGQPIIPTQPTPQGG